MIAPRSTPPHPLKSGGQSGHDACRKLIHRVRSPRITLRRGDQTPLARLESPFLRDVVDLGVRTVNGMQVARAVDRVAWHIGQKTTVSWRSNRVYQRANATISHVGLGNAQVIGLAAKCEETQPGLLPGQAMANPGLGPTAANCFGDSAMVSRLVSRCPSSFEKFV